jgi:hypothetical protein
MTMRGSSIVEGANPPKAVVAPGAAAVNPDAAAPVL